MFVRNYFVAAVVVAAIVVGMVGFGLTAGESTVKPIASTAFATPPFPDCKASYLQLSFPECQQGWRYDPDLDVTCPVNRYVVRQEVMDLFTSSPWWRTVAAWAAPCSRVAGPSETPNFWYRLRGQSPVGIP